MKDDFDRDDEIAAVALGYAIRTERKLQGWSKQYIEDKVGISRDRLSEIERGRRKTKLTTGEILQLASALGDDVFRPYEEVRQAAERKVVRRERKRQARRDAAIKSFRTPTEVIEAYATIAEADPIPVIPILLRHAYGGTLETWNQWRVLSVVQNKERAIRMLKEIGAS